MLYMQALCYYMLEKYKDRPLKKNFNTILSLIRMSAPDNKGRSELDDLFNDFMIEVYKEKIILGESTLVNNDVRIYIEEKRNSYDDAAKISDASVYKLGQTYIKFLIECGLVENAKSGMIQKPYIDYTVLNLLEEFGYRDFITIITGE